LDDFSKAATQSLLKSPCINADETSMSHRGKNIWIHILTNLWFTFNAAHISRGKKAIEDIGIIPQYCGIVVHDFWQSYLYFTACSHAFCNAHILRELELAIEMHQPWALELRELLLDLLVLKTCHGGVLPVRLQEWAREEYRKIIADGIEFTGGPEVLRPPGEKGKRGRISKPKYRNLLERLKKFEDGVLRFITSPFVPFSNNDAERPVRMQKAPDKISGCFKGMEFVKGFCRIRGYIVSCQKNRINPYQAIVMMLDGEVPAFIKEELAKDDNNQNSRKAA
jgi:transposase